MSLCKSGPKQIVGKTIKESRVTRDDGRYELELAFTDGSTFAFELISSAKLRGTLFADEEADPENLKL